MFLTHLSVCLSVYPSYIVGCNKDSSTILRSFFSKLLIMVSSYISGHRNWSRYRGPSYKFDDLDFLLEKILMTDRHISSPTKMIQI